MGKETNTEKKVCKKCGGEIPKKAKKCMHCGAKQGLPIWLIIIIVIVVIALIGSAGGSGSSSESKSGSKKSTKDAEETQEKFSYTIDKAYVGDYGVGYYIEGSVTNNKDKDYSYVSIEFICYDAAGNNLGTALDNTNNLLGKQVWKYKAAFIESDAQQVDHCDFHEVSGF